MNKTSNKLPQHSGNGGKNIIGRIALAEFQSLFFSPIAWIILIVFTVQMSLSFTGQMEDILKWQDNTNIGQPDLSTLFIMNGIFGLGGLYNGVLSHLYLFIPLLTMGLMSREFQSGSIKLLYSSPVKNHQIILGKFLCVMVYNFILLLITFIFVLWSGLIIKDFGWAHALTAMLGAYLLICSYGAIGLFMSSLTPYQVIAAVSTLAVLSFFSLIGNIGQGIDGLREITYWLAINGRAESFISGLICTEDVLYFIIVSLLFIILSIIRLNAARQKHSWSASASKYAIVIMVAIAFGYLSSRPQLMAFYDSTFTKKHTLTPNSQAIVKSMKGGLKITTFVNLLDDVSSKGMPQNRKMDINTFRQFIRYKPETEMNYVYYYADNKSQRMQARYPGLSARQMLEKICIVEEMDPDQFLTAEEVEKRYRVDLKAEDYRMVRLVERESGERTFLRMFDDPQIDPQEAEISAAFKRLTMTLPTVGFLQGHGERSFERQGDRSYRRVSVDKLYRRSLINNGFDFKMVQLDKDIPQNISILVIADMRQALNPEEKSRLDAYLKRGGNLFVLGDVRRQETMNPLISEFGVQFMPGQLVRVATDGFLPDFTISRPTDTAVALSFPLISLNTSNFKEDNRAKAVT